MNIQVRIDGREVTHPMAKRLIALGAFALAVLILSLLVFVVLPLMGLALGVATGLAVVGFLAGGASVPLLLLGRRRRTRRSLDKLESRSPPNLRN